MDKKKIRSEITALKKMLPLSDIIFLSDRIKKSFCDLDVYKSSKLVYSFMSYNQEVRTRPMIEQAWKDGKKVAIPKIADKENMVFHYIDSFEDVSLGFGGIYEPHKDDPVSDTPALVMVPGLAFDYHLNRIGYGSGFYDKFFASHKHIDFSKVAVAYDFQIYKQLDVIEEHDERLDLIVTPTMIIS